jgi:hypothetical protein
MNTNTHSIGYKSRSSSVNKIGNTPLDDRCRVSGAGRECHVRRLILVLNNQFKRRLRPRRWAADRDLTAQVLIACHAFVQNLRRSHYELAVGRSHYELAVDGTHALRVAAAFTELV